MQIINSYKELDLSIHTFINSYDEINKLVEPLVTYFGLDCFNYIKTFHDNSQIRLTNTPDWLKYYLSEQLYLNSIFEVQPYKYTKNKLLWANIKTHRQIISDAGRFGILNGITLIEAVSDGCEFYFLATMKQDFDIVNTYLSKLRLLDKFVIHFRNKGKTLLKNLSSHRVLSLDRFNNQLIPPSHTDNHIDMNFLAQLAGQYFTGREFDCIRFLLLGYSAKIIGEKLNVSNRTVEQHIINIKNKLKVSDKNQLIYQLNKIF